MNQKKCGKNVPLVFWYKTKVIVFIVLFVVYNVRGYQFSVFYIISFFDLDAYTCSTVCTHTHTQTDTNRMEVISVVN